MALKPVPRTLRPVRVVLSTPALMSFVSVWKATAFAIAQLGIGAFFLAGIMRSLVGDAAVWWVLAAWLLSVFVRAIDIESCALLIPGGTIGRLRQAFGRPAGQLGAAAAVVERLLLISLAAALVGQYLAVTLVPAARQRQLSAPAPEDLAVTAGILVIGVLWTRSRSGLTWTREAMAKGIWIGVAILVAASMWGLATLAGGRWSATVLFTAPPVEPWTSWPPLDAALLVLGALAFALPAIGGGEPLSRLAHELAPPRLQALRRTSTGVLLFTGLVTGFGTLTFILLVPSNEQQLWVFAPLVGMVHHASGPDWLRNTVGLAVAGAAVLVLAPAVQVALGDLQSLLHRLSTEGMLPGRLTQLHRRFGTPAHIIDLAAASSIATLLAAAARVDWLGRAYGLAVLVVLLLNIAALVRLRERNPGAPYRAPLQLRYRGRDLPVGLVGSAILLAATGSAVLVRGDLPSLAAADDGRGARPGVQGDRAPCRAARRRDD